MNIDYLNSVKEDVTYRLTQMTGRMVDAIESSEVESPTLLNSIFDYAYGYYIAVRYKNYKWQFFANFDDEYDKVPDNCWLCYDDLNEGIRDFVDFIYPEDGFNYDA